MGTMKKAFLVIASSSTFGLMPEDLWLRMKTVAARVPKTTNETAIATPTSNTSRRSISVFTGSGAGKGSIARGGKESACEMGSKDCTRLRRSKPQIPIYTNGEFSQKRLKG